MARDRLLSNQFASAAFTVMNPARLEPRGDDEIRAIVLPERLNVAEYEESGGVKNHADLQYTSRPKLIDKPTLKGAEEAAFRPGRG